MTFCGLGMTKIGLTMSFLGSCD